MCNSQVVSKTHAAVQDAHNAETVRADAVDDDVRTYRVGQMRRGQVAPPMAVLRVLADRLERVVDLVAVGRQLRQTPCFTAVAQDIDEILLRPWGELGGKGLRERISVRWRATVQGVDGALDDVVQVVQGLRCVGDAFTSSELVVTHFDRRLPGRDPTILGLHPPDGVAYHLGRVAVEATGNLGLDEALHRG